MTTLKTLYEADTAAWSENQADALRAAAKGSTNQPLDWEHLAEEIEDLGKAERRSLQSHVRNIIEHLIKLQYSPSERPRRKWRRSVLNSRIEAEVRLRESPSLRPHLSEIIADETERGARLALAALEERDELPPELSRPRQPGVLPVQFAAEQILGDWLPTSRKRD